MDMSVGLGCKNSYLFTMSILNTIFSLFYKVYAKYGAKNCVLHNVIMNAERKSIAQSTIKNFTWSFMIRK